MFKIKTNIWSFKMFLLLPLMILAYSSYRDASPSSRLDACFDWIVPRSFCTQSNDENCLPRLIEGCEGIKNDVNFSCLKESQGHFKEEWNSFFWLDACSKIRHPDELFSLLMQWERQE